MPKPIPKNLREAYGKQLSVMCRNGRRWLAANADKKVVIQYNFPPTVALIAPISSAVKKHFVSANDAGLELIKALWTDDGNSEPTVLMVRTVIEHINETR